MEGVRSSGLNFTYNQIMVAGAGVAACAGLAVWKLGNVMATMRSNGGYEPVVIQRQESMLIKLVALSVFGGGLLCVGFAASGGQEKTV